MGQTFPDPMVPGELLGMALLEVLPHGATWVGGTKPAEPALSMLCSSLTAFSTVKAGVAGSPARASVRCHFPHPTCNP